MKNMTITMPYVAECGATECAYNISQQCHARAITVGLGINPACATYFEADKHTEDDQRTAGIGSCKATTCKFNEDYECVADSIKVGNRAQRMACLTYSPES